MASNQPEKTILDNLNTAVMLFDSDLHLTYINPAGEMMLAVSARHVLNHPASELVPCPDHHVEERLQEALRSQRPFTDREINLQLPDGHSITVNCTALPLSHVDTEGGLLVEMTQVDRQLRITREEQLLSQHQAAQALIRGLAHEIKNPLGGLRGAAQLLEQELPDKGLREYTRIIMDEADRLQSLMNRMLGPIRPSRRTEVNIHDVLERVRVLLLAESPSGPAIRRDYDPSIPELLADSDRLIQAFLNIARNGVAAAGESGCLVFQTRILRQFTIGNRRHRLVLRVLIEDDGPGIPAELRDRIFFPMVTGTEGGTGLGLPIAQDLINRHKGLIECESQPGKTRFLVYLPLESTDA